MNDLPVQLTFRAARVQDKTRVLEITAHTWENGDYISEVWDRWLANPQGELTVVEADGNVVAVAKLTILGPDEAWLEGLRVDQNYRQHGIGKAMHHYQIALARRLGVRIVRYATGHNNVASHRIAAGNGFRQVASFSAELQADIDQTAPLPGVLAVGDWPALCAALADAVFAPLAGGLYECNWKWYNLSQERLRAHLEAGQVVGLWQAGCLAAWAIVDVSSWTERLCIDYIEGSADALPSLASGLRGYAGHLGKEGVEINAFEDERLLGALEAAGYAAPRPFSMHVFEKWLQ